MNSARALSSRAAVVRDVLLAHPAVASARTFSADGNSKELHAVILPHPGAKVQHVRIVHTPEELPAASHDRVGLHDLLRAVHNAVDSDGDGRVTRDELAQYLHAHQLQQLTPSLKEMAPEHLSFADFKNFLLHTHIVSHECDVAKSDKEVFGAHASLVGLLSEAFFDSADTDSDGVVTLKELEKLFDMHSLGDAEHARRAFLYYDGDGSRTIDREEFLSLLLGRGLSSMT